MSSATPILRNNRLNDVEPPSPASAVASSGEAIIRINDVRLCNACAADSLVLCRRHLRKSRSVMDPSRHLLCAFGERCNAHYLDDHCEGCKAAGSCLCYFCYGDEDS